MRHYLRGNSRGSLLSLNLAYCLSGTGRSQGNGQQNEIFFRRFEAHRHGACITKACVKRHCFAAALKLSCARQRPGTLRSAKRIGTAWFSMTTDPGFSRHDQLVQSIYGGLLEPAPWSDFLQRFSRTIKMRGISLIFKSLLQDERSGLLHICESREWIERYNCYFYPLDPLVNIPVGKVLTLREHVGTDRLGQSEYFHGFMKPVDLVDVLALDGSDAQGRRLAVRISRFSDEPPFNQAQKNLLQQLMPHLLCSAGIHAELINRQSAQNALTKTLGNLEVGAIVLDSSLRVLDANYAALQMWTQEQALIVGKHLKLGKRQTTLELSKLVNAAINDEPDEGLIEGMRIPREDGTALGAVVAPFPRLSPFAVKQNSAILLPGDPHHEAKLKPERLITLFGLTMAEARVAQHLARGCTVDELSQVLAVSVNTVRKHVRSIYGKVGVPKQTDLIRILMKSLATL